MLASSSGNRILNTVLNNTGDIFFCPQSIATLFKLKLLALG